MTPKYLIIDKRFKLIVNYKLYNQNMIVLYAAAIIMIKLKTLPAAISASSVFYLSYIT